MLGSSSDSRTHVINHLHYMALFLNGFGPILHFRWDLNNIGTHFVPPFPSLVDVRGEAAGFN